MSSPLPAKDPYLPGDTDGQRPPTDWLARMIQVAALVTVCTGLTALAGWLGDMPSLKSVLPGAVEMKANTAVGLIAAGAALWMLEVRQPARVAYVGKALAGFVGVLGLATLGQYLFGWRLGIDELLFLDNQGAYSVVRGRMSPYSAAAFASIGLALLILQQPGLRALAYLAATATLIIGTISALGYAWNASELTTDVLLPPVAVNTAVAFIFLGTGTLLSIHKRLVQKQASAITLSSVEGKVLVGFASSFLLLAIGGGLTYQATKAFTGAAQWVTHTQQVRVTLSRFDGNLADAALAQRNYLISGRPQLLDQYRSLMSGIAVQIELIRALINDNPRQRENLAALEPMIASARALLDEGVELYRTQGFGAAKKLIDSGQGLDALQAIDDLLDRMDALEEALLVEREADFKRFQRYMLSSTLLTLIVAAGVFTVLFREIRREMRARQLADQALLSTKNAAELARREADAANTAKSTFLATMSHEIRTPMNGVLGMLELLSLTPLDGSQHAALKVIRESGKTLMRIIDDILDFSKIEAHKLGIHPEPTSLADLIEDLRNTYSSNASSKGLPIHCRVDAALSPALQVDPVRLRQILNNFVSNAIKFTSSGQIDITVDLVERREGAERVRFCVKDTGIGISDAHQKQLFQPFAQAELNTARRYGGTGLGLSISRRLAGLMGGAIELLSESGQGTTMTLELLLPVADPTLLPVHDLKNLPTSAQPDSGSRRAAPSVTQAAAEGTLVLLADDHPTNRLLLMRQINLLGYAAESAKDGLEALQMWKSGRFGLLVTDCNMPEMDGYELAKAIRTLEAASGTSRRCPIIACTANALRGEAAICLEAGMDDYIAKPVELKSLLVKLEHWLPLPAALPVVAGNSSGSAPAAGPIDHPALARMSSGDATMEREIFSEFQRANDEDAARLRQAVTDREGAQVKRLVHLIKGASAMIGATGLSGICARIERANGNEDWNTVMACMVEFHREVGHLNQYFAGLRQPADSAE